VTKPISCYDLALRIDAHLKRFEADPVINARCELVDGEWHVVRDDPNRGVPPYVGAHASASGRFVRVRYVSFQGTSSLTQAEATAYLAWLDAGNVGTHHKATREMKS
jgi:hypothetical protein